MSGVLNALVAVANSESMVVTVGNASGTVGYTSLGTPVGSISPSTFRGKSVTIVRSTSGVDLQIGIDDASDLPQGFFTRLTIEDGTGVIRSFNSADASFVSGGVGGENWNFGNGSNRVWVAADATEQHRITFYL